MTKPGGPSPAAGAATVATVYAVGAIAVALIGHRSLGVSVVVALLVWAGAFLGWWLILAVRDGHSRL